MSQIGMAFAAQGYKIVHSIIRMILQCFDVCSHMRTISMMGNQAESFVTAKATTIIVTLKNQGTQRTSNSLLLPSGILGPAMIAEGSRSSLAACPTKIMAPTFLVTVARQCIAILTARMAIWSARLGRVFAIRTDAHCPISSHGFLGCCNSPRQTRWTTCAIWGCWLTATNTGSHLVPPRLLYNSLRDLPNPT